MTTKNSLLTALQLRCLVNFDAETGVFTWSKKIGQRSEIGALAGSKNKQGYLKIQIYKQKYSAHRLAWLHHSGRWPAGVIDHINGVRDDDRIANLRDVAHDINMQNRRHAPVTNRSTGILGVSKPPHLAGLPRPYTAKLFVNNKARHLGCFETAEAASDAYVSAKRAGHKGCTL